MCAQRPICCPHVLVATICVLLWLLLLLTGGTLWQPVETHAELESLLEALLACAWVLPAQEVEDFVTRRLFNKASWCCLWIGVPGC